MAQVHLVHCVEILFFISRVAGAYRHVQAECFDDDRVIY